MKNLTKLALISVVGITLTGCEETQNTKDQRQVEAQQSQYAASQPVPLYDWSLERHLVIELYNTRNMKAATHSVWRSNYGQIEGDCASMGFGIPYDTSLTNPLVGKRSSKGVTVVVEQPEPNGIFASKNTAATWVLCTNNIGVIEPVYVETKVTTYPYPVTVDYITNRVVKAGDSSVGIHVDEVISYRKELLN